VKTENTGWADTELRRRDTCEFILQEIWDTARRISCATTDRKEKTVIFQPFVVDMLEVVTVPVSTGTVDCWMDIRRGQFPNVSTRRHQTPLSCH
jgi:hypothetical protein